MKIDLTGKNAHVGGSSRGIGRAIAVQMALSGANVTVVARSEGLLQDLVHELDTSKGQHHQYIVTDYSDFEKYKKQVDTYFQNNRVDILVNNTQGPSAGSSLEKATEDYQQAFDLLFKTVQYTTQAALEQMMKKKWGRIINVASISVKQPLSYLALSNTIRAAVVTWGKTLATDVGPSGITVNSVLTGFFDTERIEQLNQKKAEQLGIAEKEVRRDMEQQVPVKRIGLPEEYGFLATFLASDQAAYITGTAIPIDGGLLKSI